MNTPTDAVLPVADEGQPVPANGQNSAMQRLAGLSQNDYVASCSHYPAGTPLDRTFRCLCLLESVPPKQGSPSTNAPRDAYDMHTIPWLHDLLGEPEGDR